jgi:hypothetical protein
MINWKIAGNPLNWIIVMLMAYIGLLGVHIVTDFLHTRKG